MHKYLGDMPREIMEYLPEIDHASCMLTIVLVRHTVRVRVRVRLGSNAVSQHQLREW